MSWDAALAWPLSSDAGGVEFFARSFGGAASDLNVDFDESTRPSITTELVARCIADPVGRSITSDEAWGWTTPRRLQALLAIVTRTCGDGLDLGVTCPREACGEFLELPLRLSEFEQTGFPTTVRCNDAGGPTLELKVPTGDDLRRWWQVGLGDEPSTASLAASLIVEVDGEPAREDQHVDDDWLASIEEALEACDPLNGMSIETCCPHCDTQFPVDVDLEKELLLKLEMQKPRLLDEVHCIATAYHWTEEQILELSAGRRRQYIDRIDGGGL